METICQQFLYYPLRGSLSILNIYTVILQARLAEMAKTQSEAEKQTAVMDEGRGHHIGDFLPPEELNKFMNKYKVYTHHTY